MLSRPVCAASPRKNGRSVPVFADGLALGEAEEAAAAAVRRAGGPFAPETALVSPVSVKTKSVKPDAGRNWPFSGRLNGVPPFALASGLALNVVGAVDGGVVDRDPAGVERAAVGVEVAHERAR